MEGGHKELRKGIKAKIMEMKACDTIGLQQVSETIHDAWFEKTDIQFNPDQQVVEIPIKREKWDKCKVIKRFLFAKKLSTPVVRSLLSLAYVQSYEIKDTAHIGSYDINRIRYYGDSLIISSNFPFTITLKVSRLEVSLVDTDETVGERTKWSFIM